jgi:hypothetical protein
VPWYPTSFNPVTGDWQSSINPFDSGLEDGSYQIIPKAEDNAGNVEVVFSTCQFTWDLTKPTFTVVTPSTGVYINTLSVTFKNSEELSSGRIIFEAETSNNGETATSTDCWHLMNSSERSNTSQQTITTFYDTLHDGNTYKLSFEGIDLATSDDDGSFYFSNILYDATPPEAYITYPDKDYHSEMARLEGTATDPVPGGDGLTSDVAGVYLTIQSTVTSKYWDGDSWEPGQQMLVCNLSPSNTYWYYDMSVDTFTNGQEYDVEAWAYDNAGSTQTTSDTCSFIYDETGPSIGITKPQNIKYYRSLTQLSGTANDDKELDRIEVRISLYCTGTALPGIRKNSGTILQQQVHGIIIQALTRPICPMLHILSQQKQLIRPRMSRYQQI